jgi:hypothetical protein
MEKSCEEILDIDTEDDSIDDVLESMRDLKRLLRDRNQNSMIPFLEAYIRITEGVKKASENGEFSNPEALEQLDLKFADLYFEPMQKYLVDGEKSSPWVNYFDYVERSGSIPLLELLIGINSHINSDLAVAIHETSYDEKEDYEKVNEILEENLFRTLKYLAVHHRGIFSLGAYTVHPVALKGLDKVKNWRRMTWKNAHSENFSSEKLENLTEENAEDLIRVFHGYNPAEIVGKPFLYADAEVELH